MAVYQQKPISPEDKLRGDILNDLMGSHDDESAWGAMSEMLELVRKYDPPDHVRFLAHWNLALHARIERDLPVSGVP